ncbi:MAG: KDO2-lipid IV(A) lauroyltransferase [Halieaceae bacterium]|jgi:KDO2-lipid IV(A) lauroyltransferase
MNAIKAASIKGVLRLCSLLPLSWVRALGRVAAIWYWPVGGRSRRITERNIQLAFPELSETEQLVLAKRSVAATAELVMEMGHVWLKDWRYVQSLMLDVQGAELIEEAQREGRGVIVLAPHLGNWEMIGLHLGLLGSAVSLYEPPALSALGPMIERARQRSGATLVPTDARGLATLLKSVKRGNISGILPDQAPPDLNSGENSLFMGTACFTGTLSCNMIRRTGALAVFGFAQRVQGGFILRYLPCDKAIYDEDNHVSLGALNAGVENCLRFCEEQYQWEYKRFRVRPRQGPGVYDDL